MATRAALYRGPCRWVWWQRASSRHDARLGLRLLILTRERVNEWISEGGWLVELLLPRTDAGVVAQLAAVVLVAALLLWRVRRHADLRLLVAAVTFFVLGLFSLRAMH